MNAMSEQPETTDDVSLAVHITVQLFELNSAKHEILDLPTLTKTNALVVLPPAVSKIITLLLSLNSDTS